MDLKTKKVYKSRAVVFHEHVFPFPHSHPKHVHIPTEPNYDEHPTIFSTHFSTEPPPSTNVLHSHDVSPLPENDKPIRRSNKIHKTLRYLDDYMHLTHGKPFCFATLPTLACNHLPCLHWASAAPVNSFLTDLTSLSLSLMLK